MTAPTTRRPGRVRRAPEHNAVGQMLREWREYHGLSMAKLAAISGVSKVTIFNVEHGLHDPRLCIVQSMANAMGLTAFVTLEATEGAA